MLLAWLRCIMRGRHNPARYPLGGFRCVDCGEAGANLDEMGYPDSSLAPVIARTYARDPRR